MKRLNCPPYTTTTTVFENYSKRNLELAMKANRPCTFLSALLLFFVSMSACTPRVEVAVPDKPITINLNVKIDHEVRLKVENDLEKEIFSENSDLF